MKKFLCIFLCFMLVTGPALAQDPTVIDGAQVTALERGDRAPYDGILLSDATVAKLRARLATEEASCRVRIDHQAAVDRTDLDHAKAILESRLLLCQETAAARLDVKDAELAVLAKRLEDAEKARLSGQFLFGGGVVVGVGLTVLAGWAIGQAAP